MTGRTHNNKPDVSSIYHKEVQSSVNGEDGVTARAKMPQITSSLPNQVMYINYVTKGLQQPTLAHLEEIQVSTKNSFT